MGCFLRELNSFFFWADSQDLDNIERKLNSPRNTGFKNELKDIYDAFNFLSHFLKNYFFLNIKTVIRKSLLISEISFLKE